MEKPTQLNPIAIVYRDATTKQFELNKQALRDILLSARARNCELSVVSVAGAFRKGKSFLLSFFLRYLEASTKKKNFENWMGDPDAPLTGFSWKGGSSRHTTGILIWPEIFYYTKEDGTEVGIILMDTQGTFDNKSTMKDNVTIFSFSTMLSSVQIYNMFNNIQEDDLQDLQLFTEYGKLALEKSSGKPFQQLLFLIRDWSYPYEYGYGEIGGNLKLNEVLETNDSQHEELRSLRTHIRSCYEKLSCFLMAAPGRLAIISKQFNGKLKDLDPDFIKCLKELVPLLLSKENIVVKKFNGESLKAKELLNYIDSYWTIFQSGEIPTPTSIFDATARAICMTALEDTKEYYNENMDKIITDDSEPIDFAVITKHHENYYEESLKMFRRKAVLGSEQLKAEFFTKITTFLHQAQVIYMMKNDAKKSKNLNETIDNMNTQIADFKLANKESTESFKVMESQLTKMQTASEDERLRLVKQVMELERSVYEQNQKKGGWFTNAVRDIENFFNNLFR